MAAGGGVLPPKVSAAILRGDSRLKAIRNWRGETQVNLASKTGNGQGYLSDLESGRRAGAPETIAKVAQALNVPEGWLSQLHVARQTIAGTRGEISEQQDHAASSATPYVATWHIELRPGKRRATRPEMHRKGRSGRIRVDTVCAFHPVGFPGRRDCP
ncbi:MAG: helix-turn-helix domain-containing protein [Geminicoccaceae bacterium]|uniref:helix-turn-helix domain-containing protein n=1 Tax=Reyranella sp. TaxID=1929291 RepID=UPI003D118EF4